MSFAPSRITRALNTLSAVVGLLRGHCETLRHGHGNGLAGLGKSARRKNRGNDMSEFLQIIGIAFMAVVMATLFASLQAIASNTLITETEWRCTEISKTGQGECINYHFIGKEEK
jgi:hypothetical protein